MYAKATVIKIKRSMTTKNAESKNCGNGLGFMGTTRRGNGMGTACSKRCGNGLGTVTRIYFAGR